MITPYLLEQFPEYLQVSGSSIEVCAEPWEEVEKDPRGILLMFEPPIKGAKYIMGLDPTVGITGWSRATRTDGDHKTDNAAIEIFRIDGDFDLLFKDHEGSRIPDIDPRTRRQKKLWKDVQVAEYAAPIDATEAANVANILGRIYTGDEEDMCKLIWEAYPGPGLLTTQQLFTLGYSNMWMWEYIDSQAEETDRPGWRSTATSQRLLWYRARRHLLKQQAVIRSKWLLEEYSNAEIDESKMRARAAYGYHDDRFQAANMCFWAGHQWSYEIERGDEPVTTSPTPIDYQRYAPTLGDDLQTYGDWRSQQLAEFDD